MACCHDNTPVPHYRVVIKRTFLLLYSGDIKMDVHEIFLKLFPVYLWHSSTGHFAVRTSKCSPQHLLLYSMWSFLIILIDSNNQTELLFWFEMHSSC